jgi:predicted peptidase
MRLLCLLVGCVWLRSGTAATPAPGVTLVPALAGEAAKNQADLLLKLRALPKEVASEARDLTRPGSTRSLMRYRLFKPLGFDPAKSYPVVLSLHGGGPRRRFEDLLEPFSPGFAYGLGRLVSADTQSRHPAFVVAPWSGGGGWDVSNLRLVIDILAALRAEFKLDTNRLYVTGQSMGGHGTWAILAAHPGMFAAAIPICGWGDPANAALIKGVPIWALHGTADTIVPVSGSRDIVQALQKAGGKPIYSEYQGATHAATAERAYCEPDLIAWLFAQTRK